MQYALAIVGVILAYGEYRIMSKNIKINLIKF
jgi:hypothetical protein